MKNKLVLGDCLDFLRTQPDRAFSAASFSPPYGVGSKNGMFDVRKDFTAQGRFFAYAKELSRTCDVWGINLTQKVDAGHNTPFLEQLVMALVSDGVELFDRWTVVKPAAMPARGNRALTRFEYVLLFSAYRKELVARTEGSTVLMVKSHNVSIIGSAAAANQLTPYFAEIPRQIFAMYGSTAKPVLDPFAGSGTSLLVADSLGLPWVGVEKLPAIYEDLKRQFPGVV